MAVTPQQQHGTPNPKYRVPQHDFIGVEHPFRIVNHSKAIESLGGESRVGKLVEARKLEDFEFQLHLHPGRYQHNSVVSANTAAKSLVCQVTIPKLIGRKRKRKEGEHEGEIEPHGLSEQQMLSMSLKTHGSLCNLRFLGEYNRVHKFRTMPDFVFSLQHNRFMQKFHNTVMPFKYEKAKQFKLDDNEEYGADTDLVPPPLFSPYTIPFNYAYQQNASVKVVVGNDGEAETLNEGTIRRSLLPRVAFDIDQIPNGPSDDVPPLHAQPADSKELVERLQTLFAERPIWSRRAIYYHLRDSKLLADLKWLLEYVGYEFATGPWAATVIRYGIDPRSDSELRIYQSITLQFDPQPRHLSTIPAKRRGIGGAKSFSVGTQRADNDGVPGYIFTGTTIAPDGKTWQICDIQDPLMRSIISTKNLRSECDSGSDGWFKNGTWMKAKIILRYKVRAIAYQDDTWTEEDFVHASEMPDEFDPTTKDLPVDTTGWNRRAITMALHIKHSYQGFSRARTIWNANDVSSAELQTLEQHDNENTGELADLEESFEDLLEEGNLSNDNDDDLNGSDGSNASVNDEDV